MWNDEWSEVALSPNLFLVSRYMAMFKRNGEMYLASG
jgi:hypothetical protein